MIPEENAEEEEDASRFIERPLAAAATTKRRRWAAAATAGGGGVGGERRRRFTKLDQAWRSEALLRGNGPLTNLKGMVFMDKRQRKQLAKGVARSALGVRARRVLLHVGPGPPAPGALLPRRAALRVLLHPLLSLDDQRSTMDKQRSRERQIIAHGRRADRKERYEQQQHNDNNNNINNNNHRRLQAARDEDKINRACRSSAEGGGGKAGGGGAGAEGKKSKSGGRPPGPRGK